MNKDNQTSRRDFFKSAGLAALATGVGGTLINPSFAEAKTPSKPKKPHNGPYNILMITTDQERHFLPSELPKDFKLPGHERLAKRGVVFENHQIASCVCTPARAVMYTGQHIQHNGMFDNTNFPWSGDLSTKIGTLGDLLRKEGYYTAYKGKWHLTTDFETINKLHAPKKILNEEMEAYGFSDYFGIGDIIGHTTGGYLHDGVISAMSRSWLRGKAEDLKEDKKAWFLAVNLVNPHDVMYYNTDLPGETKQTANAMMHMNREPNNSLYKTKWNVKIPLSRKEPLSAVGRPSAHKEYVYSNETMVGYVPNEDERYKKLNNYYLNCLRDVDNKIIEILDEIEELGLDESTIIMFTSDHGELAGAHGLTGKGATAYREQNNVPLIILHPAFEGGKICKAVTSQVDIATTLVSMAGGNSSLNKKLPGKDITTLLKNPEKARYDTLRTGALFNFNMFAFVDADFLTNIREFLKNGGSKADLGKQGFRPNLNKRGAIRSIHDGQYTFSRYFSPLEHHIPKTIDQLFAKNDVELYDLVNDPYEMNNLARDRNKNAELIEMMNNKLNALIKEEVGEDIGQMLPKMKDGDWKLSSFDMEDVRL